MPKSSSRTIHLFSSNNRELYERNCINLMAQPAGSIQRFRYRREWISLNGREVTQENWAALATEKANVITYFVDAKRMQYGDPVYVPLREGTVIKAVSEGPYFFIDFRLGAYIDNRTFKPRAEDPARGLATQPERAQAVLSLSTSIRKLLNERYPAALYQGKRKGEHSAIVGEAPYLLGAGADDPSGAFTSTAAILSDLMSLDGNSSRPTFLRLVDVRKVKGNGLGAPLSLRRGDLKLAGGCPLSGE